MRSITTWSVLVVLLFSLATLQVKANENERLEQLKMEVYYETLCPDSIRFIEALYITLIQVGKSPYVDLQLIPFGKAKIYTDPLSKELKVECHHGQEECVENANHACVVENITKRDALFAVYCNMYHGISLEFCLTNYADIQECRSKRSIAAILQKYGEATEKVKIVTVPTVLINGEYGYYHVHLTENLNKVICYEYKRNYGIDLPDC